MKRLLILVMTAVFLFSPTPVTSQQSLRAPASQPDNVDLNTSAIFPARGGKVDLGLALSGGGIRSGSYSIGVLKALYDAGLLEELDAVSSVSGGGFANFWLMNHDANGPLRFGQSAFESNVFLSNMCSLQNNSQMFSLGSSLLARAFPKGGFRKWRGSVGNSFTPRRLDDNTQIATTFKLLAESVNSASKPLPIFNATLATDNVSGTRISVEITPFHFGNEQLGYSLWPSLGRDLDLLQVIATSAAGDFSLRQPYPNFSKDVVDAKWGRDKVELYDGGCFENLGALPLIRRGLEHVVIIDAEHDPRYRFEGFVRLREALREIEIELNIPDIEKEAIDVKDLNPACPFDWKSKSSGRNYPLRSPLVLGKAINNRNGKETNIYYLKMSSQDIPDGLNRNFVLNPKNYEVDVAKHFDEGSKLSMRLDHLTKTNRKGRKYTPHCIAASCGKMILDDLFSYKVNRYYFFNRFKRPLDRVRDRDSLVYDFPHITSADQSYFPDQMEALIGLGYLQARPLAQVVKQSLKNKGSD